MNFVGKTNKDYVMINTLTFRLNNGKEVTIDREYTGYDIDEEGNIGMTWKSCYFWDEEHDDPNNPAYLTEDDEEELSASELIAINVEDDADDDYFVILKCE